LRIENIQVLLKRSGSFRDELTVTARLEGVRVFEHTVPVPPVDDVTTVFDQIFEVAKEAMRSAILKAKEIDEKP
jgi:hypothetical protein